MKNLRQHIVKFKLVDVEGSVLSVGQEIIIREPVGFDVIDITLERDNDAHGLMYEFSEDETDLGFVRSMKADTIDPYTFIETVDDLNGVDGNVNIVITYAEYEGAPEQSLYTGALDFSTIDIQKKIINISSRRVDFDDKFRSSVDTKYDIANYRQEGTINKSPSTPEDTYLHGYIFNRSTKMDGVKSFTLDDGVIPKVEDRYLRLPIGGRSGEVLSNSVKGVVTGAPTLFEINPTEILGGGYSIGGSELQYGEYSLKARLKCKFNFSESGEAGFDWGAANFVGTFRFAIVDGEGNFKVADANISPFSKAVDVTGTASWSFELDTTLIPLPSATSVLDGGVGYELSPTDTVYIYANFQMNSAYDYKLTITDFEDSYLEVDAITSDQDSLAVTYSTADILDNLVESMTEQSGTFDKTRTFVQNLGDIRQTSGYALRNFVPESTLNNTVFTSFNEQFKGFLKPLLGAGYAIVDIGGVNKLILEHRDFFYQDDLSYTITTIEKDSYSIEKDLDLVYNEISAGYKVYPKSTDENKDGNLEEYNTLQEYTTPIKRHKATLDLKVDLIASGYKLNNQRKEQYSEKPPVTVSDDDKMFVVKTRTLDDGATQYYKNIDLQVINDPDDGSVSYADFIFRGGTGEYVDLRDGDTFLTAHLANNANGNVYEVQSVVRENGNKVVKCYRFGGINNESRVAYVDFDFTYGAFDGAGVRAERNEPFDILANITRPDTVYNVGLNPTVGVMNHGTYLNSGFVGKSVTSSIVLRENKLGSEMTYRFKAGEGDYITADKSYEVTQGDDIPLSELDLNKRKFSGRLHSFTSKLPLADIISIRQNMLNEGSENYGVIEFIDPIDNVTKQGWIMRMTYSPWTGMCTFTLRGKHVPKGGRLDQVLDYPMS